MKINTQLGTLDLSNDCSVQIDETNPVFNDRGSQSLPLTVPVTPNNARLLGFPHRVDLATGIPRDMMCYIHDAAYLKKGCINVLEASRTEGISLNIGFDNAEAYSKWQATRLADLEAPVEEYQSPHELAEHINQVFLDGLRGEHPYAVFTVCTQVDTYTDQQEQEQQLPVYINRDDGGAQPGLARAARDEQAVIDSQLTTVSVPEGYGIAPFLYVWKIIDIIFLNYGYQVHNNPFYESQELRRIVVVNNAADACVTGTLNFAELMPDCTVEEFLNALYVRFGFVYQVSDNMVRMSLIRDVVAQHQPQRSAFDGAHTGFPLITYETPKQVQLKAGTSLEGAAPAAERWEDFDMAVQSLIVSVAAFHDDEVSFLNTVIRELPTGRWWKLDTDNFHVVSIGSSFFAWDRQTPSVETVSLTSVDECVPMLLQTLRMGVVSPVPQYRKGMRHRHTYVRTAEGPKSESDDTETPLAFLLALPTTYGRTGPLSGTVTPYDTEGKRIQLAYPDAAHLRYVDFSFSLLFQFTDGLFSRFWKDYDAILRHACNKVQVDALLPVGMLADIDMLMPCLFKGQRMLPDCISYMLPAVNGKTAVQGTFRTLALVPPYDLYTEQGIVEISDTMRIMFVLVTTDIDYVKKQARRAAQQVVQNKHPEIDILRFTVDDSVDFTGYVIPQNDEEVRDMRPEEENIHLTRTYICCYRADITYKGFVVDSPKGSATVVTGCEHYVDDFVTYQAFFVSRQV